MDESIEYIEAYFEKQLDEPAMRRFERQCEQDADFARDVALYITTREAMRQALAEQKREQWRPLSDERRSTLRAVSPETGEELPSLPEEATIAPAAATRKLAIRRWMPYAVAASLLLFVAIYFSDSERSLNRQVASAIQEEIAPPSPKMGIPDTLELAKNAYKNKEYDRALQLYGAILQTDSLHDQALLHKGRIFLIKKNYDSALHYFNTLSGMELASNSGPYDAALTLLERNQESDQEKAKELLQKIVDDKEGKLEGKKQAQGLLDLMK